MISVTFKARGHENVRATHATTLEITKQDFVTKTGDCIILVNSELGASDLPDEMKEALRRRDAVVLLELWVDELYDRVIGKGSPELVLSADSIVFRTSDYIDPRTVMIKANKSARDINRELINELKKGKEATVRLSVF
jgi:hypothetical protein